MKYTVYGKEIEIADEFVKAYEEVYVPLDDIALKAYVCQGNAKDKSAKEMEKAVLIAIKDILEFYKDMDNILNQIRETISE